MNNEDETTGGWYGVVLSDLRAAFRRDGLVQSAEMLDDVAILLAQEQARLEAQRAEVLGSGKMALKLIVN